jgi:hypothetical protein
MEKASKAQEKKRQEQPYAIELIENCRQSANNDYDISEIAFVD